MNIEVWIPRSIKSYEYEKKIMERISQIKKISNKYAEIAKIPKNDYVLSITYVWDGPNKPLLNKQTMFVRIYCSNLRRVKSVAKILSPFADVECYQTTYFVERVKPTEN